MRFGGTGGNGVVYTYDRPGRLLTEATFGRTLSYQYDPAGNRTRITWPDALYVQYTYDALNRMLQVRENGATSGTGLLATYSYDNLGRRSGLSRGNTVMTSWGYDGMSRLTSLAHNPAGTTHDLTVSYGYNPASQLISRNANNDAYVWPGPANGTTSYAAANGLNQYPSIAGAAYGYDPNGNLTTGGSRTRTYDVENRLVSITGSPNLALEYDPLGRLRQATAGATPTQLLYAGDSLVAEYNSGGTLTKRYVHGAGIDEPLTWYEGSGTTDRRWLLADERGSVIAHTTAAGAATPYSYGPYGEPNAWTGSRFRYTGQIMLPEAQLYHYKARAYDQAIGRFLQTDPVGYEAGINLYSYLENDPLNARDSTGACPWCLAGATLSGGTQLLVEAMAAGGFRSIDASGWQRVGLSAAAGLAGGGVATAVGTLATITARTAVSIASGAAISAGQNAASTALQENRAPTAQELANSAKMGAAFSAMGASSAEVLRATAPSALRAAQSSSLADRNLVGSINKATIETYTPSELRSIQTVRTVGESFGAIFDSVGNSDLTAPKLQRGSNENCSQRWSFIFGYSC